MSEGAHQLGEALGHGHQHTVADRVSEAVVDGFEVVQVQVQHSHRPPAACEQAHGVGEAVQQQGAVGQPGQRVVQGEVSEFRMHPVQLLLQLAPLIVEPSGHPDVAGVAHEVGDAGRLGEHAPGDTEALAFLQQHADGHITPGEIVHGDVGQRERMRHREFATVGERFCLLRRRAFACLQIAPDQLGAERTGLGDHRDHVGIGKVGGCPALAPTRDDRRGYIPGSAPHSVTQRHTLNGRGHIDGRNRRSERHSLRRHVDRRNWRTQRLPERGTDRIEPTGHSRHQPSRHCWSEGSPDRTKSDQSR